MTDGARINLAETHPGTPAALHRWRASFQQEKTWAADRLLGGAPVYQWPLWLRISAKLDVDALSRALELVSQRHRTLRTHYRSEGGSLVRVVGEPHVQLVQEQGHPDARYDESARVRAVRECTSATMTLEHGEHLRANLISYASNDHDLVLVVHQMASDRPSLAIVCRDLGCAYEALRVGKEPAFFVPLVDYGRYAEAQLPTAFFERRCRVVAEQLGDLPGPQWIAPQKKRPATPTYRAGRASRAVPSSLSEAVQKLAEARQVSIRTVWMALTTLLVHRLGGHPSIVFGIPVSLRTEEYENTVGDFTNTVPTVSNFDPVLTFEAFVDQCERALKNVFEYADTPCEMIANAFRERGHEGDLFRSVFAFEEREMRFSLPGGWEQKQSVGPGFMHEELFVQVHGVGDRFFIELYFREELFAEEFAKDFVSRFLWFAEQVCASPNKSLLEYPLLQTSEMLAMRSLGEGPRQKVPTAESVLHGIARRVATRGNAPAVIAADGELTYSALWARAEELAHALVASGVQPEDFVGICLPPGLELAVAMLATLRVRATFIPLDGAHPSAHLLHALQDSGAQVVITTAKGAKRFKTSGCEVLVPERDAHTQLEQQLPEFPRGDERAYMIYTSGSTGKPKGVPINHHALLNHNLAYVRLAQLRPGVRALSLASPSQDVHLQEVLPTLLSGGTVVYGAMSSGAPRDVFDTLVEHEIEVLCLGASQWHALTQSLLRSSRPLPEYVRFVIIGGERAIVGDLDHWKALAPKVQLVNGYGPTEATIIATSYDATEGLRDGELPIGRPMENQGAFVVSAFGDILPRQVAGELWLTGAGLSSGYWGRPELSQEHFVSLQVAPGEEVPAYRTGDRARWHRDGVLMFLGRRDAQAKVHGFRVEPAEVEAALESLGGVQAAAVVAVPEQEDSDSHLLVAAYVGTRTVDEVRTHLSGQLPPHMVPTFVSQCDDLPRLPNGKVDRRAVGTLQRAAETPTLVQPRDPTELALADIWKEVLSLSRVGVRQDFYSLGGNTQHAIRVVDRATAAGLPLVPRDFVEDATLAGLARAAEARLARESSDVLVTLEPRGDGLPIVFFHALPGDVLRYGGLVHELGSRRPCIGVQSLGLRNAAQIHTRVADMAKHYAEQLHARFGTQGLHLAGWRFGGHLALETARVLKKLGTPVVSLAMLEGSPLVPRVLRIRDQLRTLRRGGVDGVVEAARQRLADATRGAKDPATRFALEAKSGMFANRARVYRANRAALERYQSTSIDEDLLLVKNDNEPHKFALRDYGWGRHVRRVWLIEIQGPGDSLLEAPHVTQVAAILNRWCDQREAKFDEVAR